MSHGFNRQRLQDAKSILARMDTPIEKISDDSDRQLSPKRWTMGVEAIDDCLPEEGLSQKGLHEIEPLRSVEMPSLTGFAFGLLSRLPTQKPIIWCVTREQVGDYGQPYAFGLARYGIHPSRVIFTKVSKAQNLHFAMEEALKTEGIAAVLGEGARPHFTGSRRLSLLCETHQTPCLYLVPHVDAGKGSAALTRFQIAPEPGQEDPRDPYGPGLPTWRVALPRARHGRAMPIMEPASKYTPQTSYPWRIVWDDQTLSFHTPSIFSRGAFSQTGEGDTDDIETMVGRRSAG